MKRKPYWWIGLALLGVIGFCSVGLDLFFRDAATQFNPDLITSAMGPSWSHWFGTDDLGRDVWLRCLSGAKISLGVGVCTMGITVVLGSIVGVMSGFLPSWVDMILMRFTELMMGIPSLFLILALQAILGPSIWHVVLVIGLTSWMGVARVVRAEVLSIKSRTYITAARARGFSTGRLMWRHVLPNAISPIIVMGIMGMGGAILMESALSFLGMGVQPPQASWGNLLENSLSTIQTAPWLAIAPGIWIGLTVWILHWTADQLR